MVNTVVLNKLAISTIQSDYIRKYLTKIDHKFTLEEQVTIIYNSDLSLEKKYEVLKNYLDNNKLTSEHVDNLKLFTEELHNLVKEIENVLEYCSGKSDYILVYSIDNSNYCASNLKDLLNKISTLDSDSEDDNDNKAIEIFIHSLKEVETIGSIVLNEQLEIQSYDLIRDYTLTITDKYVFIPNDICMGDTIKTIYDDERFIVVNNIHSSKLFNTETYKDSVIIAIPESVLDSSKDYKSQIESIYMERIKNIENPCAEPDIIMVNYLAIPIVSIIKID